MILATRKAPIFGSKEARQLDVAQHESSRNVNDVTLIRPLENNALGSLRHFCCLKTNF